MTTEELKELREYIIREYPKTCEDERVKLFLETIALIEDKIVELNNAYT